MAGRKGLFGCGCLVLLIAVGIGAFILGNRYGKKVETRIETDVQRVEKAASVQVKKIDDSIKKTEEAVDSLTNDGTSQQGKGRKQAAPKRRSDNALNVDFKI